jgi:hypothetical protein
MREIYTSPRHENIDRVVALMAEHGIQTRVNNRAVWQRPSYSRFSYVNPGNTEAWPQVEISFAADLPKARQLMREAGIEPLVRHADVLNASRDAGAGAPAVARSRKTTVNRVRTILLAAVAVVLALMVLKGMHLI